jgi:cbb3-type cytochrome oxidase maturation protein
MQVLFIVVPLAMVMAGLALAAFFIAVRRGQFDDLDTPQYRAIFDDAPEFKEPSKLGP